VAAATLNPVEFRAWEHRTFGEDYERPRPRMFIHYTKSDGEDGMWSLKRVPVCDAWIDEHGMENSLGHPGVKEWLKAELERARIDPETVVAMEIVDAVKMRLRVKAEDHACPHCTLHTDSAAADHLVEATPAPAKATGGGWLSRLRTVFVGG